MVEECFIYRTASTSKMAIIDCHQMARYLDEQLKRQPGESVDISHHLGRVLSRFANARFYFAQNEQSRQLLEGEDSLLKVGGRVL